MILLLVTCMNYLDYVVPNILVKTRTFKCHFLEIQEHKEVDITVPEHVFKELLKLHGIEFNGRNFVIKKAKTPSKKTTGNNKQASKIAVTGNRF